MGGHRIIRIAEKMGKIPALIAFVAIFFFILRGMIFYVGWRFILLFDLSYTHLITISLTIAGIGVLMNLSGISSRKKIYYLALTFVWFFTLLTISAIVLLFEQALHLNFWFSGIGLGLTVIVVTCLIMLLGYRQHKKLISTPIVVQSEKLKANRKVVFVADLHVDGFHGKRYIKNLVGKIMLEDPDVVLIGGDLINYPLKSYIRFFRSFKRLKVPVYAVIGNHDVYFGDDTSVIEAACIEGNISLLRNQSLDLFDDLQLVGIEDEELRNGKHLKNILIESEIKEEGKFTLLLSHRPYLLSKLSHTPIDLELAGHTHKGQIWGFTQFSTYLYDYVYGLATRKGKKAFITQGVGSILPIRLGTQGEIVVLHLETK